MSLLPDFVQRRIAHRPNLVKIAENVGWLFVDKILRMGVGLFVGVWVARYLGPEQFGLLNFALAFTGLFGAMASLGLQGIVVRELVREPSNAQLTLGTAAVMQLAGGLVAYLLTLAAIAYLRPDDPLARAIVAILGAIMLLNATQIAAYWFESQVQSKYTVAVHTTAFIVFAFIKVLLILNQASIFAFVWALLAEAFIAALILLMVMGWHGPSLRTLRVDGQHGASLLRNSWPLLLSAMAITVYFKIDQIMLGQMLDDQAVGIYSAATRLSEVWYFIPMTIVASVFPAILRARQRSSAQYYRRLQSLYNVMVWMAIAIALPATVFSTFIVNTLYGTEYAGAGRVLAIHIWAAVFVFLGVASGKWFLAENRQLLKLQRSVLGAVSNVILNLLLIPRHGAAGAAVATLISYAIADLLFDAVQSETRQMFMMKLRAFYLFGAWR